MQYRLALVEYLNTLPFYEGLRLTDKDHHFDVRPVAPSMCAQLFKTGEVDISLCPVGALDELPPHKIIGNYCIGADGPVNTVVLLSKVPLDQIRHVQLDPNSRTSNLLVQILAKRWWKKDWIFESKENGVVPDAYVMIGDRVFTEKPNYPFVFDLAETWKALTGLPMVFAVWIAKPEVDDAVGVELDMAFLAGMDYVLHAEHNLNAQQIDYLKKDISYPLDMAKRRALALYREWAGSISAVASSQ